MVAEMVIIGDFGIKTVGNVMLDTKKKILFFFLDEKEPIPIAIGTRLYILN